MCQIPLEVRVLGKWFVVVIVVILDGVSVVGIPRLILPVAVVELLPLLIRNDERKRESILDDDCFRWLVGSAFALVVVDLCRSSCGVIGPKGKLDFGLSVTTSVGWVEDVDGGGGRGGGIAECGDWGRGGTGGGLGLSFIVVLSTIDHRKRRRRVWAGFAVAWLVEALRFDWKDEKISENPYCRNITNSFKWHFIFIVICLVLKWSTLCWQSIRRYIYYGLFLFLTRAY